MSYNQQTLDAMKIIVNSELDKRKYDITLVCEIIGEDENNKNRFLVKSDSMKFYAMLQNTDGYTTYRIGDTVNILVPNGDYTQTKFITGKYSSYDEIPKVSDVLHPSVGFAAVRSVNSFKLEEGKYVPTSTDRLGGRAHLFKEEGKTQYIYLSTNVQSNAKSFEIRCTIEGTDIDGQEIKDKYLVWYSDDMMGNISNMPSGFPQEILLTSTELQEYNTITNVIITIANIVGNNANVTLSNTSFAIGYLNKDIKDDVYIYTEDDNYEYSDPASKNIYAFAIKNKQFIFPSTNNTFYWYLYTEGYSTTDNVTSEENKILWKKIDYAEPIQLHVDKIISTIKVEYIEEEKIVYSATQQFTNTKYNENAKGSGTLLLTTDRTYCPIYDNYGRIDEEKAVAEKKVVTAKRGDLSPFNINSEDIRIGEKYITWKFDLESQIKFPYSIVEKTQDNLTSYEWYPELPDGYSIYNESFEKIEPKGKEWRAPESGYAYVTQPISDAAAAPSISFYFKDEFSLDQNNILIAFTHTNNIPNEGNHVNKGEISFTLGFGDNSGTGYAFNIINEDKEHPFFTYTGATKIFSVILQNKNGEQIDLSEYQDKIKWTWLYDELHQINKYKLLGYSDGNTMTDLYYQIFSESQIRNGLYKKENDTYVEITEWPTTNQDVYTKKSTPVGKACEIEYINGIEDVNSYTASYNFHVLVATLQGFTIENGQMINLQAFYPIGITGKDKTNILTLQGSTYAIYDSFGKLSNLNDKDKKYIINNVTNITKIIQYTFDNEANFQSNELITPFTSLFSDVWEPTPVSVCLCDYDSSVTPTVTNKLLYIPLLSIQNTWFSQNINAWDGKLKIDNEGNYILSAMIGAGSKNVNNQFTGVIMGDVGKDIRNAESGIYGFKDGQNTFKISAQTGNFRFGTVDQNITFNGEKLLLKDVQIQFEDDTGNEQIKSLIGEINDTANDALTNAKGYVSQLDTKVTNYLTGGGTTALGDNYVISPYIGGGYLNITSGLNQVIIDPNNLTGTNCIFQVQSSGNITVGIDKNGNAEFAGKITSIDGEIGGWNITREGLSKTTPSNFYAGYPAVFLKSPTTWGFSEDGDASDVFVIQNIKVTDKNGNYIKDYPFVIKSDGSLTASKGTIGGWNITSSYIDTTIANSKKRLFLASASDTAVEWIGALDANGNMTFKVTKDGYLTATGATITGNITAKNLTITDDATITGLTVDHIGSFETRVKSIAADSIDTTDFVTIKGTFKGTLSGVDGIFTGTLSGAKGDFTGTVTSRNKDGSYGTLSDGSLYLYNSSAGEVLIAADGFRAGNKTVAWQTLIDKFGE